MMKSPTNLAFSSTVLGQVNSFSSSEYSLEHQMAPAKQSAARGQQFRCTTLPLVSLVVSAPRQARRTLPDASPGMVRGNWPKNCGGKKTVLTKI